MQESQLPRCPWDKLAIDTIRPYPTSYNGNKYLIIVMYLFTLHPETYTVPDTSAQTVANVCTKLVPMYSSPIAILSNSGWEYKNKIVEEVWKILRIE